MSVLPNIDLSIPVTFEPWNMKDRKDSNKKVVGISIYQNGKKIEKFYTREDPKDCPDMVKKKVKGVEVWDDTDRLEFFEKLVEKKFKGAKVALEVVVDVDDEEAPF